MNPEQQPVATNDAIEQIRLTTLFVTHEDLHDFGAPSYK